MRRLFETRRLIEKIRYGLLKVIKMLHIFFQGLEDEVKGKEFSATEKIYLMADEEEKNTEPAHKKSREC